MVMISHGPLLLLLFVATEEKYLESRSSLKIEKSCLLVGSQNLMSLF